MWVTALDRYTVESQFLEPPRETKIGFRNRDFKNIGGKITLKQIQGKQLLVQVIGGLRNQGFEKSGFHCINVQRNYERES